MSHFDLPPKLGNYEKYMRRTVDNPFDINLMANSEMHRLRLDPIADSTSSRRFAPEVHAANLEYAPFVLENDQMGGDANPIFRSGARDKSNMGGDVAFFGYDDDNFHNRQPDAPEAVPADDFEEVEDDLSVFQLPDMNYSRAALNAVFWLMFAASMTVNIDHGAIPAATNALQQDMNLTRAQLGFFGSLVFAGIIGGSVFASVAFGNIPYKIILMFSLLGNGIGLYCFSSLENYLV